MARIVNYCTCCIGRGENFEALGTMEIAGFRYTTLFLAAVKLGNKLVAPSPGNTQWMNSALLEQTRCIKIFFLEETNPTISKLPREGIKLLLLEIPSFNSLPKKGSKNYPFRKLGKKLNGILCSLFIAPDPHGLRSLLSQIMVHSLALITSGTYLPFQGAGFKAPRSSMSQMVDTTARLLSLLPLRLSVHGRNSNISDSGNSSPGSR